MSARRTTSITFLVVTLIAMTGLVVAGASDRRDTAFPLDVADGSVALSLASGQTVCQGPMPVRATFSSVGLWTRPSGRLRLVVRTAGTGNANVHGGVLASGTLTTHPGATGAVTVGLGGQRVTAGETVDVCLEDLGRRPLQFEGGLANSGSGTFTVDGHASESAVALSLQRPDPPSLLSELPRVFARAGLFKFAWVGAWTYWALAVALIVAVGLLLIAVSAVAGEDADV